MLNFKRAFRRVFAKQSPMVNDEFRYEPNNAASFDPATPIGKEPYWLAPESPRPVNSTSESYPVESPEDKRILALSRELRRSYSWLGLLSGLSILSIGLLSGLGFWLHTEQSRLQQQLATSTANKAELEDVQNLENRLNVLQAQVTSTNNTLGTLTKRVPNDLPTQLKTLQGEIASLRSQVQNVQSNAVTREQLGQSIQRAIIIDQSKPLPSLPTPAPTPKATPRNR